MTTVSAPLSLYPSFPNAWRTSVVGGTLLKMAPKDVYQDDGSLSNFLDGLIQSASDDRADVLGIESQTSPSEPKPPVEPERLVHGISVANDLLREGGQCPPLPFLTENNENVDRVLAAALSTIVRLSRCCKANVSLRVDAENRFQATQIDADRLSRVLHITKDKVTKREGDVVGAKNKLRETEAKNRRKVAHLTAESNSLRTRLAAAEGQINQLNLEAKKRERQYTHLQQRVHALMSNSKKLSIEPAITRGEGNKVKHFHYQCKSSQTGDDSELEVDTDEEVNAAGVLLVENNSFRRLLHSIQVEMDDIIGGYTSAFKFLHPPNEQSSETSDVSDGEEETSNSVPAPAPTLERMLLPFDIIGNDVEGLIDEKFSVIRKALERVE